MKHPSKKEKSATNIVAVVSDEKVIYLPVDGQDEAILNLCRSTGATM